MIIPLPVSCPRDFGYGRYRVPWSHRYKGTVKKVTSARVKLFQMRRISHQLIISVDHGCAPFSPTFANCAEDCKRFNLVDIVFRSCVWLVRGFWVSHTGRHLGVTSVKAFSTALNNRASSFPLQETHTLPGPEAPAAPDLGAPMVVGPFLYRWPKI
jgi:hypothetical protein